MDKTEDLLNFVKEAIIADFFCAFQAIGLFIT